MKNSGLLTILASTLCTSGISNNIWNLNYEDLDNTSSKVIQTEEEITIKKDDIKGEILEHIYKENVSKNIVIK